MNMQNDIAIVVNSNISKVEKRGVERIYRVLGYTESWVYLHEIGVVTRLKSGPFPTKSFVLKRPPRGMRSRLTWSRQEFNQLLVDGTFVRVAEHGIPAEMARQHVPPSVNPGLDLRRDVVSYLTNYGGNALLADSRVYSKLVKAAGERFNVSTNSVRKWVEMYLFFGKHENALIDQDWRKGAPGVSRRKMRDEHGRPIVMGRRTDSEILGINNGLTRRRLTQKTLTQLSNFMREQATNNDDAFPVIFRRWQDRQLAWNRDSSGSVQCYPIDPRKLPGLENVKRHARRFLKQYRADKELLRRRRPGENGGSAQDVVNDQLSGLDIDGTIASNFIRFGDGVITIKGEAKPTIILAVDRASTAIVGWDVSFGTENGNAYLNCIFSAYTAKDRELIRWGVPHLEGFVYGCTNQVFLDRGPGISMATQKILIENLKICSKIIEPGRGQGKGHGERGMKFSQESVASLSGSTFTTGNADKDKIRRKLARKGAVSIREFMAGLLKEISRHNLGGDVKKLLTPSMMKDKLHPTPYNIYMYHKLRRRGDAAWDWASQDIFKNLCTLYEKEAPDGTITLNSQEYSSPELRLLAKSYAYMNSGKSLKVKIYKIPNVVFLLLWEMPGSELGLLEMKKHSRKSVEDSLDFGIKHQNMLRNSLFAEAQIISTRKSADAKRVEFSTSASQISKAKQKKIDEVEIRAEEVIFSENPAAAKTNARHLLETRRVENIFPDARREIVSERNASDEMVNFKEIQFSIDDAQELLN